MSVDFLSVRTERAEPGAAALYREMTIEDYEAAIDLWNRTPGIGLSSADERAPFQAFLARNPSTCLAAEIDDRVIGTAVAGHDGRRGYLYHVAVDERYRRLGIGGELVRRVLCRMSESGVRKC